MKPGKKFFVAMFVLTGMTIIGSATYIGVSFAHRKENGLFDTVEIKDINRPISSECDLGVMYPGEEKTQTLNVKSLLSTSVAYSLHLGSTSLSEETGKYFSVTVQSEESESISLSMKEAFSASDSLISGRLQPKGSHRLYLTYSLNEDVPEEILGKTFGFEVVIKANMTL